MMIQKISIQTSNADLSRIRTTQCFRSGDISDVAKMLRKEDIIKKKLKSVFDLNATLQKQIKVHEVQIGDERATINYQLGDLLKEMSCKFQYFTDQNLQRKKFQTNQISQKNIQQMMKKYQKIQSQCQVIKKIFQFLSSIQTQYKSHSSQMQQIVMNIQITNRSYEQVMQDNINEINQQIRSKQAQIENIKQRKDKYVVEIDKFIKQTIQKKQAQKELLGKVEKLKRIAFKQQQQVNQIQEWDSIVVDMSDRKFVFKTLFEKQQTLRKLQQKNSRLEVYLKELQNQQKVLNDRKILNQQQKKVIVGVSSPKNQKKGLKQKVKNPK